MSGAGLRCPPAKGGQRQPPANTKLFFIFRCFRENMIVGVIPFRNRLVAQASRLCRPRLKPAATINFFFDCNSVSKVWPPEVSTRGDQQINFFEE